MIHLPRPGRFGTLRFITGSLLLLSGFCVGTWAQSTPATRPALGGSPCYTSLHRLSGNHAAPNTRRVIPGRPIEHEPIHTLKGHTSGVLSIAFSPNGKLFVTSSADRTAKLWNVQTGALVRTFSGHKGWVFASAFSPDGKRLVTAARDGIARVFDIATGDLLAQLKYHDTDITASILDVKFVNKGKEIVTAGNMGVLVWDWDNEKILRRISGPELFFEHLAVSEDEKTILLGTEGKAQVRNFQSGARSSGKREVFQGWAVTVSFFVSDRSVAFLVGNFFRTFYLETKGTRPRTPQPMSSFSSPTRWNRRCPNAGGGLVIVDPAEIQAARFLTKPLPSTDLASFANAQVIDSIAISPDHHYLVVFDEQHAPDPQPITHTSGGIL